MPKPKDDPVRIAEEALDRLAAGDRSTAQRLIEKAARKIIKRLKDNA